MRPEHQTETNRIPTFVFEGTVMHLHASTESNVQSTVSTAILRVDNILHASEALQNYTGVHITLHHNGPTDLRQGQRAFFFTEVLIYSESLLVQEVEPRAESADAMKDRLLPPQRYLQQRIRAADLIVEGEVRSVEIPTVTDQPISEHDPMWAIAKVAVSRVLKGDPKGSEVTVFFPQSIDHLWYKAPKFQEGQRGIWLLSFAEINEQSNEQAYTALDPRDFQAEGNVNRIMALL